MEIDIVSGAQHPRIVSARERRVQRPVEAMKPAATAIYRNQTRDASQEGTVDEAADAGMNHVEMNWVREKVVLSIVVKILQGFIRRHAEKG